MLMTGENRRDVAQFGSASGLGPEGRRFESCHPDQIFYQNENGSLAQLGEHLPYKQRVTGSSPVTPTICWCSSIGRAADL